MWASTVAWGDRSVETMALWAAATGSGGKTGEEDFVEALGMRMHDLRRAW
jgi:hypothetical protein